MYLTLLIIILLGIFRPWNYTEQVNFAEKFKDKTYDIIPHKDGFSDPFGKEYTIGGRSGRMSYIFSKDSSYIDYRGVENTFQFILSDGTYLSQVDKGKGKIYFKKVANFYDSK